MVKLHLKRLSSPKTWPIKRKGITFISRPNPGPHPLALQLPITVLLRDVLGFVQSKKEVKFILHQKGCLIDGKYCYDDKRPIGLLDVLSLPKRKESFRVSINKKNKLIAVKINDKEASTKVCKITKKSSFKKNITHIGTNDGRSFRVEDAKKYSVGDSLLISLPNQKIIEHLPLEKKSTVMLWKGKHVGVTGVIDEVIGDQIIIKIGDGLFKTSKKFAIVIGKTKPVITVNQE